MAVGNLTGAQCPKSETNYRLGSNRGCWMAPEYDRLAALFATTLDPKERATQVAQMARVYGEDLPTIPLFYLTQPYFWVSGLQGVTGQTSDGDIKWNMYEWEWIK
jgi:ABC-type transport system substrate-binding protein